MNENEYKAKLNLLAMKEIEMRNKTIEELSLNELSELKRKICNFPKGVKISLIVDGKEIDKIGEYIDKRRDDFFDVTKEDYRKIIGKCFINEEKNCIIKVVGYDVNEFPFYDIYNFLYEKYEKHHDDTWHCQDYIWLQEEAAYDQKYKRYCLSSQTEVNLAEECMFHLGVDGNLYIDYTCGGDYIIFKPISNATFEVIKEEAISNDGEYKPGY